MSRRHLCPHVPSPQLPLGLHHLPAGPATGTCALSHHPPSDLRGCRSSSGLGSPGSARPGRQSFTRHEAAASAAPRAPQSPGRAEPFERQSYFWLCPETGIETPSRLRRRLQPQRFTRAQRAARVLRLPGSSVPGGCSARSPRGCRFSFRTAPVSRRASALRAPPRREFRLLSC